MNGRFGMETNVAVSAFGTPPVGMMTPVPGLGGATTTSIGVGLPQPGLGAMSNPGLYPPNGIGMTYPNYQYQGRGINGDCCGCGGGDWCGSNFGSG